MPLPSKPALGAVEPSPVAAIAPESIAVLRGRRFSVQYVSEFYSRQLDVVADSSLGVAYTECGII